MQVDDAVDQQAIANGIYDGMQLLEFFELVPMLRVDEQLFLSGLL